MSFQDTPSQMQAVGSCEDSSGCTNDHAKIKVDAGTNRASRNVGDAAVCGMPDDTLPMSFLPQAQSEP